LSHERGADKRIQEKKIAPNFYVRGKQYSSEWALTLAKSPANCGAVFGHPVATELEQIVHVVSVNLRLNEQVMSGVQSQASRKVYLEMIRAFQVLIAGRTTRELIAIAGGFVKLQIHST
jgi:hypothetical protein